MKKIFFNYCQTQNKYTMNNIPVCKICSCQGKRYNAGNNVFEINTDMDNEYKYYKCPNEIYHNLKCMSDSCENECEKIYYGSCDNDFYNMTMCRSCNYMIKNNNKFQCEGYCKKIFLFPCKSYFWMEKIICDDCNEKIKINIKNEIDVHFCNKLIKCSYDNLKNNLCYSPDCCNRCFPYLHDECRFKNMRY